MPTCHQSLIQETDTKVWDVQYSVTALRLCVTQQSILTRCRAGHTMVCIKKKKMHNKQASQTPHKIIAAQCTIENMDPRSIS